MIQGVLCLCATAPFKAGDVAGMCNGVAYYSPTLANSTGFASDNDRFAWLEKWSRNLLGSATIYRKQFEEIGEVRVGVSGVPF